MLQPNTNQRNCRKNCSHFFVDQNKMKFRRLLKRVINRIPVGIFKWAVKLFDWGNKNHLIQRIFVASSKTDMLIKQTLQSSIEFFYDYQWFQHKKLWVFSKRHTKSHHKSLKYDQLHGFIFVYGWKREDHIKNIFSGS